MNKNLKIFSYASFFVPLFALCAMYIISTYEENVPLCIPLIEGCTSVSRAARRGSALNFFRLFMIPSSVLICLFWIKVTNWLQSLGEDNLKLLKIIRIVGIASALTLIFYLVFLGSKGNVYSFMRRFGIIGYFGGTGIAQLLFLKSINNLIEVKMKENLENYRFSLCLILYLMLALGFSQVIVSGFFPSDALDNIIEWNYAVLMHMFFLLTGIYLTGKS